MKATWYKVSAVAGSNIVHNMGTIEITEVDIKRGYAIGPCGECDGTGDAGHYFAPFITGKCVDCKGTGKRYISI